MPKGWSRVVWATPGTASGQAEEGEAGTDITAVTGRCLGPESWTLREAEAGAGTWRGTHLLPWGRHSPQPTGYVG